MARVVRIVDSIYPGYLAELHKNYPSLSEKDIYLIAMMACGFSTGTICALRRISENSLYVEKPGSQRKSVRISGLPISYHGPFRPPDNLNRHFFLLTRLTACLQTRCILPTLTFPALQTLAGHI